MTVNDILMLAKAGFTAQQISGIYNLDASPKAEPEQASATATAPTDTIAAMTKTLGEATAALNAQMMRTSMTAAEQPKEQSPEEILASIINPKEV